MPVDLVEFAAFWAGRVMPVAQLSAAAAAVEALKYSATDDRLWGDPRYRLLAAVIANQSYLRGYAAAPNSMAGERAELVAPSPKPSTPRSKGRNGGRTPRGSRSLLNKAPAVPEAEVTKEEILKLASPFGYKDATLDAVSAFQRRRWREQRRVLASALSQIALMVATHLLLTKRVAVVASVFRFLRLM